ncbi:MAG: AAA family ATPase [Desulfobulbaceae bacterium]|jgi:predicted ATPase|nr:AAA family ATPase [Desulfobulbaceae bacterium]
MNPTFSRLQARGFRHLHDLDMPFAPLNVFIGVNGVGKSSILEVMRVLAASANGQLQKTINAAGGLASLKTYGRDDSMSLRLEMPVAGKEAISYELSLQISGTGYRIAQETLRQRRHKRGEKDQYFKYIEADESNIRYYNPAKKKLQRPEWEQNPLETSLAQAPRMFQDTEKFRALLSGSALYHTLDVSPRAPVRLPQMMQPAHMPGENGEDLVSYLFYARETDADRFREIENTLRVAFPNFERLEFHPVAAGSLALTWKETSYNKSFYTHQLSEGTLRFLWLVALLHSPELPTVTLIDEPEVSLHPEMLRLLVELFREASSRTQLIVATHSDRLVGFLAPSELVVCDFDEEGGMKTARADTLELERWLRDYSLDQLWEMGRLGGRT